MTNSKSTFELLVASESVAYNSPIQNHYHQEKLYLFEFVFSGYGYLELESRLYDCVSDSYFMIPPDVENKYWAPPGVRQEKIFFICSGQLVKSLLDIYQMKNSYIVKNARSLVKYFKNMLILAKQYGPQKDREAAIIFHKFIQEAHSILYKNDEPPLPPLVYKLRKILDTNLEKKVDFNLISKEIAYSQAYLVRTFKKHMGVTPHEYLLCRRLETAQLLLRHSTLSIKEIAERLVFSDQYHFSNFFKKRTGFSPSDFRKPQ